MTKTKKSKTKKPIDQPTEPASLGPIADYHERKIAEERVKLAVISAVRTSKAIVAADQAAKAAAENVGGYVSDYLKATGYAFGIPPLKPPGKVPAARVTKAAAKRAAKQAAKQAADYRPTRGTLDEPRSAASSVLRAVEKGGAIQLTTLTELLELLETKTDYHFHIEVAAQSPRSALLKTIDNERDAQETIRRLKAKP